MISDNLKDVSDQQKFIRWVACQAIDFSYAARGETLKMLVRETNKYLRALSIGIVETKRKEER